MATKSTFRFLAVLVLALAASWSSAQNDPRIQAMRLYSLAKRCLAEVPDISYAIDGLRASVKVDPTFVPGHITLASVLYSNGDLAGATAALEAGAAAETDVKRKAEIADMAAALRSATGAVAATNFGDTSVVLPVGDADFQRAFVNAALAEDAGLYQIALASVEQALQKAGPEQAKALTAWKAKLVDEQAIASMRTEASAATRKRDFAKAMSLWQQIVSSPLCSAGDVNAFAFTADSARQYVSAAVVLQKRAPELQSPTKETALRQAGRLRNRAVLYKKARTSFDEGESLVSGEGIEVASVSYLGALQLDPFNSVYLVGYANALKNAKKSDQAVKTAQLALDSDDDGPHLAVAITILDEAKMTIESEIPAQRLLVTAQAVGISQVEELAAAYASQSNDKRVLDCFSKDDRPKLSRKGLSALGLAFFHLKNFAESEDCFRRQTKLDPKDSQAFADLAGALLRQKKISEAKEMARQAIQLGLTKHWSYKEILSGK